MIPSATAMPPTVEEIDMFRIDLERMQHRLIQIVLVLPEPELTDFLDRGWAAIHYLRGYVHAHLRSPVPCAGPESSRSS